MSGVLKFSWGVDRAQRQSAPGWKEGSQGFPPAPRPFQPLGVLLPDPILDSAAATSAPLGPTTCSPAQSHTTWQLFQPIWSCSLDGSWTPWWLLQLLWVPLPAPQPDPGSHECFSSPLGTTSHFHTRRPQAHVSFHGGKVSATFPLQGC